MKSYQKKSVGLISLKAKIRGFEIMSKSLLKEARIVTGEKRHALKQKKVALGNDCRHHLIAYALIRKLPFVKVEQRCREGNDVNVKKIFQIITDHGQYGQFDDGRFRAWTIDDINAALVRETSPDMRG